HRSHPVDAAAGYCPSMSVNRKVTVPVGSVAAMATSSVGGIRDLRCRVIQRAGKRLDITCSILLSNQYGKVTVSSLRLRTHLMACGLIGEPTAPVIGSGAATKKNS